MLLEAKKLDKSFNGVYALKGLDLSLKEGEIHGLVGENGAGKSTFIKILGGVYTKNGGELTWNGAPFPADFGPVQSRELGINIIFQDHVLIPAFSALENIWLGRPYPRKGGLIQWKEMEMAAEKKGEELGIHLDLKKSIFQMTPAQKKCVEILRAMMSDCKLMILDEPTASLSDKEANLLFSIIKNLKAKGTAVLYVTHRLEEIMALTDRVTVLRNGELVSTCDTGSTSQKELVRLMSGNEEGSDSEAYASGAVISGATASETDVSGEDTSEIDVSMTNSAASATANPQPGIPALTISHLASADHIVKDASLTVHTGRITGMFGLCGSGRTEFLECIYGVRRISVGTIEINGEMIKKPTPVDSIKKGIAFICEDRRRKAMIPSFTVEENMNLSSIDHYSKKGLFSKADAVSAAKNMINALKIRCVGTSQPAYELSGGNQQKVVFAKALLTSPSIWLCDEPTQAVDVATRQQIHNLLRDQAAENKAVLYVSSDLTELLEVADEIAVMASGKIRKIFPNKNLKPADILACCYEAEREETHENESI